MNFSLQHHHHVNLYSLVDFPTCITGSSLVWITRPLLQLSPAYFNDYDLMWIGLADQSSISPNSTRMQQGHIRG